MKIALVGLTHPFRGGIAHYTTLLCKALRQRHDVRFYSLSRQYPEFLFPGKTQRDESAQALVVDNEACLDSIQPFSWWSTASRIAREGAELALFSWWHPFFGPSFGTVARSLRRRGIPSCFLCHNVVPHETSQVDRLLSRYALGSSTNFITHSATDADNLRQLLPGARVLQNPHPSYDAFAETELPTPDEARRRLDLPAEKKLLLFFGYVRPYKGLDVLLAAAEQLDADRYHLVVVGEFYESPDRYAAAIERLRRRGQLTLVDRYVANEEIPGFFQAADLVIVPYLTATQSGIVQMAYGFERPVVATTAGGLPETVVEGETGHLVPPGDPEAIAAAVRRHFERPAAHYRDGISRQRARYSWERMVETIEQAASSARNGAPG